MIALTTLGAVATVAGVLLIAADRRGPVVTALGGWPAPVGIALVADRLSALLLLISTLVTLAVLVYAIYQRIADYGRGTPVRRSTRFPGALDGGVAAYLTGDLFTLFVAFEIMLAASYVLITRRTTAQAIRADDVRDRQPASSLLFLTTIALVYAATGDGEPGRPVRQVPPLPPGCGRSSALMFVVVFGIKAAIFPLHFWLPDSYPNAPAPVTALFAGLLTKVGFYALCAPRRCCSRTTARALCCRSRADHDHRSARSARAERPQPAAVVPAGQPHRVHALRARVSDVPGLSGTALYAAHHITVLATLFLSAA